jgi:hypothetical protein
MRLCIAILLALAGLAICRAEDTTYRVQAVVVDEAHKLVEAKFVIVPEDLRLVCHGIVTKVSAGDYLKVEYKKGSGFWVGNLACTEVRWEK